MRRFCRWLCIFVFASVYVFYYGECCKNFDNIDTKYMVAEFDYCSTDVFYGDNILMVSQESLSHYVPEKQCIEVGVGGVALRYCQTIETIDKKVHVYESSDENVSCWYYVDCGYELEALARICVKGGLLLPEDIVDTEQEYIEWSKSIFAQYGVEDLSDYVCECETVVRTNGYQRRFDYFYLTQENEELLSCKFSFFKYFDGYKTPDSVEIRIDKYIGCTSLEFGCNNPLLPYDEVQIDVKGAEESLECFITHSVISDRFKLKSYKVTDRKICWINERLCCVYDACLELRDKRVGSEYGEYPVELAVFM